MKEIFLYVYFISLTIYWLLFWPIAYIDYRRLVKQDRGKIPFLRSKVFIEYITYGLLSFIPIINSFIAMVIVPGFYSSLDYLRRY